MTRSIASGVRSLKSTLRHALAAKTIHAACRDAGHAWRARTLDPVTTIWLFALQMLHANTACTHVVRLMPGIRATDSAYCQARNRLTRDHTTATVGWSFHDERFDYDDLYRLTQPERGTDDGSGYTQSTDKPGRPLPLARRP